MKVIMQEFWQDFRFALRVWRKAVSITIPAVLILALGIGANTAIFSVADAIWLRPLPIEDPHGLLKISSLKRPVPKLNVHCRIRKFRTSVQEPRRFGRLLSPHEGESSCGTSKTLRSCR